MPGNNEEEVSASSTAIPPTAENENHETRKRRRSNPNMSHLRLSPSVPKPTSSTFLSLRTITILTLPLLSLTGFSLTWYLGERNGLLSQIKAILAQHPWPFFPGTNEPLILKYTRIPFVDDYLAVLIAFFAPAVSGEFQDLGAFGRAGMGAFGVAWTLMVMESLRAGNRRKLISYVTIFGLFIQTITLTCTLPIFLFLHLLTSPVSSHHPSAYAASALFISTPDLVILPFTIFVSFILPTGLMSHPFQNPDILEGTTSTSITPTMHQYLIAIWQFFPILTFLAHRALTTAYVFINCRLNGEVPIKDIKHDPTKSPSKTTATTKPTGSNATDYLRAVRNIYRALLTLLVLTHLPVLLSSLLPSQISAILHLNPDSASFAEIFIPANPFPYFFPTDPTKLAEQIDLESFTTFPKHVLTFLQYDVYISTLALLLWSLYLHRTSLSEKSILDPNSLPSYSPSLNSPYTQQNGFFTRTNPVYRDLLSGKDRGVGGTIKHYGTGRWGRVVGGVIKWGAWMVLGGPMAVVVLLVWERDEIVRRKVKQGN